MIAQLKKREKKGSWMISFFKLFALALILSVIGILIFWNMKIKTIKDSLNAQLAAVEEEIKNLEEKNESLKEGIARVGDEDYVEKVAREELSLQKEGEKVVSFILPEPKKEETEKWPWQPSYWGEWIRLRWQWLKNIF